MKWKVSPEKAKPKVGDVKEKKCFSFFPTKVDNMWLWFEYYIGVYEYVDGFYEMDEVVSQGIFTEKYRTVSVPFQSWRKISKKIIK